MGRRIGSWIVSALVVLTLYLFLWPVPIEPGVWDPPPVPALEGDFAENRVLQAMELFPTPGTSGPEDVAVDSEGRAYVGVEQGQILRYAADGSDPQVFAVTGGRPLGLDFDNDGNLIVADEGARGGGAMGRVARLEDLDQGLDGASEAKLP